MSLEGKVALVTGAGRGIGRAIAEELANRGADVVLADRMVENAQSSAQEIAALTGRQTLAIEVDVSSMESAKAMVEQTIERFGKVDILVNNAGITRDNLIMRMDEAEWDAVIDINLKGVWNCSKAVIRAMMKQRYGRIVNISSCRGWQDRPGRPTTRRPRPG